MTIPIASHILYIMIYEIMLQLDIEDKYITDSWFNYRKKWNFTHTQISTWKS